MPSSHVFLLRGHPGRHEPPSPGTCLVIPVDELVVALPQRLTPGHRVNVEQNLTARWRHVAGNDVLHVEPIQVPGKWFHWIPGQIGECRKPISDVHHVVRDIPATSDADKWKKMYEQLVISLHWPFRSIFIFMQFLARTIPNWHYHLWGSPPPPEILDPLHLKLFKLPKNIFHDLDLLWPLSTVVLSKHFFDDDIGKDSRVEYMKLNTRISWGAGSRQTQRLVFLLPTTDTSFPWK